MERDCSRWAGIRKYVAEHPMTEEELRGKVEQDRRAVAELRAEWAVRSEEVGRDVVIHDPPLSSCEAFERLDQEAD